ncbi:MAG: flagellar biosynthesis protein FlgE, partial [Acidocella sp. 20-61-6]
MTLQTALSGLLGAQTGLNTVSNDLANASTTAFKSQTALFSDIYPANQSNVAGIGVSTSSIASNFTQGSLVATGNPLDAALQGSGYFVVSQNGQQQYTRDGSFQLNGQGQLVTATGAQVMGYAATQTGSLSATLSPLTVNTGAQGANPTSQLGLTLNLNSGDPVIPATTSFSAANAATYDQATSVVTYDSLGNANRIGLYFVQNPPATGGTGTSGWTVYAQPASATGATVGTPQTLSTLSFSPSGQLISGSPATLNVNWGNGAANSAIQFDLTGTTLGAQSFAVAGITNNGYPPGSYTGTSISSSGGLMSTYSNGQTLSAGTLSIANFINQTGLQAVSGNLFASSQTSGQPVLDIPGVGQAGSISGGNLEQSNASTSSLLVSLIQYQQAYQANTS